MSTPQRGTLDTQQVKLGSNEGWRKGCAQYVVLLGADTDAESSPPGTTSPYRSLDPRKRQQRGGGGIWAPVPGADGAGDKKRQATAVRFADSQPYPSRLSLSRPPGLFPDVEPGADTGGGGDGALPSPRWVLRPQTVAGGKGSLAQAVRALVDERRKSRAKSRSQLLPGACVLSYQGIVVVALCAHARTCVCVCLSVCACISFEG